MKYKLDDIDRKKAFKTPDGYFDDLSLKIQKRVEEERNTSVRYAVPKWSLALAASLALIVTFFFISQNNGPSPEEMLAEVSQDELVAYLDHLDLDEYEIASAFNENVEIFDEETNVLDGIDLEDQSIDDVLQEYDLEDEIL
ncbi:hypothetical protein [Ekhidna sp.]|uniref:hypothetical protein n=1 Tax=Ekhidna sp. TaxID=2608089 RepID=UPI003B594EE3